MMRGKKSALVLRECFLLDLEAHCDFLVFGDVDESEAACFGDSFEALWMSVLSKEGQYRGVLCDIVDTRTAET